MQLRKAFFPLRIRVAANAEVEINQMISEINQQADENFRIVVTGTEPGEEDWFVLYNGGDEITEGDEFEINDRLKQIAREDWVYID